MNLATPSLTTNFMSSVLLNDTVHVLVATNVCLHFSFYIVVMYVMLQCTAESKIIKNISIRILTSRKYQCFFWKKKTKKTRTVVPPAAEDTGGAWALAVPLMPAA